jgi:hypothetical protein
VQREMRWRCSIQGPHEVAHGGGLERKEARSGGVEREGSNGEERWSGRSQERSVVNWGLVAGRVRVDLFIHDMDFAGKATKWATQS